MSATSLSPTRREILAATVAAGAIGMLPGTLHAAATGSDAIRAFTVNFPQEDIDDLRRRVAAPRWPERETVTDKTQGVQLATMQKLAQYWATGYDWDRFVAQLNALPHFITEIDGLDIHFIHVRSKHDNALPLIVTHGSCVLSTVTVHAPAPLSIGSRSSS